ncbi:MAG: transglycosylase SLT domain-containing protein [Chloroflexota bacterium]
MTRTEILQAAVAAARRKAIDPVLVAAVIEQESSFDPRAYREEPHIRDASRGLMQLLYGTATWKGGYSGPPDGLYDVETNLACGCEFLRYLLHRYAGDTRAALAAYNAGPGNVDAHGWTVVRGYVESVLGRMERLRPEVEAAVGAAPAGPPQPYRGFPLEVPYVTQLEPDGSGYNNCGPACVTMGLAYNTIASGTREVMHVVAEEIRGRPWNVRTYTNFAQMKAAAERHDIPHHQLSTWQQVYGALDSGQPVLILVDNQPLEPRQYPRSWEWNAHHFIALTGYTDTDFYVGDPLCVYPPRGPGRYTRSSVRAGVAAVGGVQALAIDNPIRRAAWAAAMASEDGLLIRIGDAELKAYLEQLGQGVNLETAIAKRACLAYRRGETRGPASSGEYSAITQDGRQVIRQNFSAGIAEYDPATGEVVWVEVVLHPETLPRTEAQPDAPEATDEDRGDDVKLDPISDADLKAYLEQLGQGVNMESAIIKRACLAYRLGETRGPAVSDEYPAVAPDGRNVVRQNFSAGIAEYDPATGAVSWVEVVLHPEAVSR